ncbi:MAG: hypothetical protein HY291_14450 [Planctomycetes bacterium]|nr:hypothetical protein [Planctomycetota bacterium]
MEAKRNGLKLFGAAMFLGAICCIAQNAQAFDSHHHHHHSGGVVGIGFGVGSSSEWVPGHYEVQMESVLVMSAHYEKQFVAPTYKTVLLSDGTEMQVKVSEGYWTKIFVPAQYESREVQVWIPGYYVETGRPSVRIGLGFRF